MSRPVDSPAKLDTLVRALNLIPYFQAHPGRTVLEAARDLGREPARLIDELTRLACCGVGPWPEELVDLTASYKQVQITNSQGMDRPLRLTPTEAGVLLLTLESLEAMPGLTDREAVISAAAKLRGILGAETVAIYDSFAADDPAEHTSQEILREAMEAGRKLRFTYRSRSSDRASTRVVDPARIFVTGGETYLTAWEEASGRHKNFRADRMSQVHILDEGSSPHLESLPFDSEDPFGYRLITEQAELLIHPDHTWLADYFPVTLGEPGEDGWVQARMPVGSKEWLVRFALGQSDRLQVTGPPELVEELHSRAASALAAYH